MGYSLNKHTECLLQNRALDFVNTKMNKAPSLSSGDSYDQAVVRHSIRSTQTACLGLNPGSTIYSLSEPPFS